MSRDVRELLVEAAPKVETEPDLARIERRARRRRVGRVATVAGGVSAVVLVAVTAVVGLVGDAPLPVIGDPDGSEPRPLETVPDRTDPTGTDSYGPRLDVHELPELPDQGVAAQLGRPGGVDGSSRLVLIGLDGTLHGHLDTDWSRQPEAWPARFTHLTALRAAGVVWVDLPTRRFQPVMETGAPLWNGYRVTHGPNGWAAVRGQIGVGFSDLEVEASWPEDAAWWLTPDHRTVSWATCAPDEGPCPHGYFDSHTREHGELEAGCRIAHQADEATRTTLICDDGASLVVQHAGEDPTVLAVPDLVDGSPGVAHAVYDGGVVRVHAAEHGSLSEALRIEGDELVPLLGADRDDNPSAVPLGVTQAGDVVLHLNRVTPEFQADEPGIYLLNPHDRELHLIWSIDQQWDHVRMWSRTPATLDDTQLDWGDD